MCTSLAAGEMFALYFSFAKRSASLAPRAKSIQSSGWSGTAAEIADNPSKSLSSVDVRQMNTSDRFAYRPVVGVVLNRAKKKTFHLGEFPYV